MMTQSEASTVKLPSCIQILKTISDQLESIENAFDAKTIEFNTLKHVLNSNDEFTSYQPFLESPLSITYVQLLFLTALSFLGGIFVPSIKQFHDKDGTVKINWGNGVHDTFTFGVFDKHCDSFFRLSQTRLLDRLHQNRHISKPSIKQLAIKIRMHLEVIKQTEARLIDLQQHQIKNTLVDMLKEEENRDMMFILLACLPAAQLNALFIHIHQFLPDNLKLKAPNGNTVDINALFTSPSSDIQNLLTKVQLYFELYYTKKFPILRFITQTKGQEYFFELMQNTNTLNTVAENLDSVYIHQLRPRLNIYKLFDVHLEKLGF